MLTHTYGKRGRGELNHFTVYLEVTQYCKSTVLQYKNVKTKNSNCSEEEIIIGIFKYIEIKVIY